MDKAAEQTLNFECRFFSPTLLNTRFPRTVICISRTHLYTSEAIFDVDRFVEQKVRHEKTVRANMIPQQAAEDAVAGTLLYFGG